MRRALAALLLAAACRAPAAPGTVAPGDTLRIHYSLVAGGRFVDSTETRGPVTVTLGTQDLLPGVSERLIGMRPGEERAFKLAPEEAFGLRDEDAVTEIPRARFPGGGADLEPGMTVHGVLRGEAKDARIVSVTSAAVTLDFNPPLAGEVLQVKVKVVEILPRQGGDPHSPVERRHGGAPPPQGGDPHSPVERRHGGAPPPQAGS